MKFGMALKLDISKVYDCVEWNFLYHMLICMGFHSTWIDWIMECVTFLTYSIQINGHRSEFSAPYRGLWQGNPISPYLFLICVEGLSNRISQSTLRGLSISRRGPSITHPLFADDSILFSNVSVGEALEINRVLNNYAETNGQCINLSKSSLMFSINTPFHLRTYISSILDISWVDSPEKFLGLPTDLPRSKKQAFAFLNGRIYNKIKSWNEQLLSKEDMKYSLNL